MSYTPYTICPKDIARIINKSVRTAQRLAYAIKAGLHKPRHHQITVKEFCDFVGYDVGEVEDFLKKN
ncbi:MAG TPA: hypothetical protein PKN75_04860 [Bacteroidia bacterium]|nr:hypothetical protein [Bacteroidia bacterium]HNU32902.1 hypothetical protein [Bacteroidia bacterium]